MQVRLVGIAGAGGDVGIRADRRAAAEVRGESAGCAAASQARSRRRRAHWRCSVRFDQPISRATSVTAAPAARLPVTWRSSASDHGAVSGRGSVGRQLGGQLGQRAALRKPHPQLASGTRSLRSSDAGTPSRRGSTPGRKRKPTNGSPLAGADRRRGVGSGNRRRGRPSGSGPCSRRAAPAPARRVRPPPTRTRRGRAAGWVVGIRGSPRFARLPAGPARPGRRSRCPPPTAGA